MASNPTIDSFTADIQSLRQELRGLKDDLAGLSGGAGGGGSMMPSSLGRVSSNSFGTFDTSSPMVGAGLAPLALVRGALGKSLSGIGLAMTATGAISSMMPSMEKYAVRESGYYMSALYSMGSSGRNDLRERTLGTLTKLGGLTSVGADATVSAILSGRGVNTSSPYYNTLMSQIGNVGRYMNMENEVAAQSMANLTGGRSSASLLQRGIFTSATNPATGKNQSLNESQIFEQLAQRWIVGSMNVDEVQDEIRRGFLGANISSLGLDAAAEERLKMYLIARAGGQKIDFTSESSMRSAFGPDGALKEFSNPFESIYNINAMETEAIEGVSVGASGSARDGAFATGLVKGAQELNYLYSATQSLRKEFGELGAILSTILGNDLGATLGNPVTALTLLSGIGLTGGMDTLAGFINNSLGIPTGGFGLPGSTGAEDVGGGGMYDTNLGSNLALPVPSGSSVSAGYGKPGSQFWDGTHNGIDYAVPEGTPVYAAADGTVDTVTTSLLTKGYGLYIKLDHGGGWQTIYAHLSETFVTKGQKVKKGQEIGLSGSSGTSSAHLHFEVQNNSKDQAPSQFPGPQAVGGGSALLGLNGSSPTASYSSSLMSSSAAVPPAGMGGSGVVAGSYGGVSVGGSKSVTINLNIASASEAEAVRFAELVKQKLEEDSFMAQMGAK